MSQAWHTCRPEELDAAWAAYRVLAERARAAEAKRNPPLTAAEEEAVGRAFHAARLEDMAQDAEDREDLSGASRLRARARSTRG